MKLCECGCGCGVRVRPGKRFRQGHHRRARGDFGQQARQAIAARKARAAENREARRLRAIEMRRAVRAGETLKSVGERYGVSRQRVEQILNADKAAARRLLNEAIESGATRRPSACESCGCTGRIEAHHDDYSRPRDVVWLCPPCHVKADARRRFTVTAARINDPADDLLTANQAAAYLGVGVHTIYRHSRLGTLRATLGEGSRKFYRRADVDRFKARPTRRRVECRHGHKLTPDNLNRKGQCLACLAVRQFQWQGRRRLGMSVYAARQTFRECGYEIERTSTGSVVGRCGSVVVSISRGGGSPWFVGVRIGGLAVWAPPVRTIGRLARVLKAAAKVPDISKAA